MATIAVYPLLSNSAICLENIHKLYKPARNCDDKNSRIEFLDRQWSPLLKDTLKIV